MAISHNVTSLPKFPGAEPAKAGVSVGACLARARDVTEGNLPKAERGRRPEAKWQAAVMRSAIILRIILRFDFKKIIKISIVKTSSYIKAIIRNEFYIILAFKKFF